MKWGREVSCTCTDLFISSTTTRVGDGFGSFEFESHGGMRKVVEM